MNESLDRRVREQTAAVRESEEKMRALVQCTHDLVQSVGTDGRFLFVNDLWKRTLGYDDADLRKLTVFDVIDPASMAHCQDLFQRVVSGETVSDIEATFRARDGSTVIVEGTATPLFRGEDVVATNGFFRDVTRRREEQAAARALQRQFEQVFRSAPLGITISTLAEGRFINVNETFVRMSGYSRDELVGRTSLEVGLWPDPGERDRLAAALREHGALRNFEYRHRTKNGEERCVLYSVERVELDGVTCALSMFNDITERKRAEAELAASEDFNRVVLAALGAHIAVVDSDGVIVAVNEAWRRFARKNHAGQAGGVDVGANYLEVCRKAAERGDPEVRRILDGIEAVLAGSSTDFTAEYPCHAPGEKRWFYMRVRPLPAPRGGAVISHENVTERKLAEQALYDLEMRLHLAAEASKVGFWDWDMVTDDVRYSPEWKWQLGYLPHEVANRYEEWESRLHPDDRQPTLAALQATASGTRPEYVATFRLRHKDGTYRWLLSRAQVTRDAEGRPVRMMGCHVDITDLKNAQAQLAREKVLSDELLESLPGIFYAFNAEGRFVRWNHMLERVGGYSKEEIAGMQAGDFFTGTDIEHVAQRIAEVFERGEATVEAELVAKDGTRTPYYFSGRRIEIYGVMCVAGLGIDVSDMKQAQAALVASEEQYRGIFNTVSDCLIVTDLQGRIVDVNEATCRLHGFSRAQLAGALASMIVPESHRGKVGEFLTAVAEHRPFHSEAAALARDGSIIPIVVHGFPFQYRGRPHALAVLRDISDWKRVEEELHELSARLIQTQDEERRRLSRELHDTTAQKLAGAAMNLELIRRAGSSLPVREQQRLEDCRELIDGATQEIRTFSYLLHPPLLDELGLDGAVRDYTRGFARRSGIQVSLDLAEELGRLPREQETALFRILQESLGNVHRHSGSKTVRVQLRRSTDEVRLTVSDAGQGFASPSLPESGEGVTRLGVGIAGMRERMRQLGGRLELASDSSGTVVEAMLPASAKEHEQDSHSGGG
ncbi:MAG TPA: hypothetical protein DCY13_12770 [Verrucomicrobiales bacterium]|nr:hypothetical protein [Verrucomicrobiales bacterium]